MTLEAQKEAVDKYCKGVNDATPAFEHCESKCRIASICAACGGCFDQKTADGKFYVEIAADALQYGAVRVKYVKDAPKSAEKLMNDYYESCINNAKSEIQRLREQNDLLVRSIEKLSEKI